MVESKSNRSCNHRHTSRPTSLNQHTHTHTTRPDKPCSLPSRLRFSHELIASSDSTFFSCRINCRDSIFQPPLPHCSRGLTFPAALSSFLRKNFIYHMLYNDIYYARPIGWEHSLMHWWSLSVRPSVRPSVPCLVRSRERKGVESWKLAQGSPWYGWPVTPLWGRKVKVTRPINAVAENESYLRNGKAYEFQNWCTYGVQWTIDVKNVFYVFFIQGTFFTFFNVFYFANVFFFIWKNVHWKYHLKLYSVNRLEFSSLQASCPLILLDMHGNHHHHHHQRTDLGGIMSITSVFTIGPFVPCTPFAKYQIRQWCQYAYSQTKWRNVG